MILISIWQLFRIGLLLSFPIKFLFTFLVLILKNSILLRRSTMIKVSIKFGHFYSIYFLNLSSFSLYAIGLVALSSSQNHAILAFPGRQKGHIQIVDLNTFHATTAVTSNYSNTLPTHSSSTTSSFPHHRHSFSSSSHNDHQFSILDRRPSVSNTGKIKNSNSINSGGSTTVMTTNVSIIPAHSGKLSCLSVNSDGSKCASASEKVGLFFRSHANDFTKCLIILYNII
jgi:hypothetical protein